MAHIGELVGISSRSAQRFTHRFNSAQLAGKARSEASTLRKVRSLERRRMQCYLALMLADITALVVGFGIAGAIYLGDFAAPQPMLQMQLLLPLFLTVGLYNGAYCLAALERPLHSMLHVIAALVLAALALIFMAFYTKTGDAFSRMVLSMGVVFSSVMLAFARSLMRHFIAWRCGPIVQNLLIIDDDGPPLCIAGAYRITADAHRLVPSLDNPATLDLVGRYLRNMDKVVVTCPPERRVAWAMILKCMSVEGEILDDAVTAMGALGARRRGRHGTLLVAQKSLGLRSQAVKRAFDLAVAIPALILLAPLMVTVALLIKLEDRGPVLFVQRRMGQSNRFFHILKFRSMRVDRHDADGDQSATHGDARVTSIGRFIRRTSIDELPQLFNVLGGSMSLVGPRPHALGSCAGEKLFWEVDVRYWQRHTLKPGLTGLAQIRGFRGATATEADLTGRLQSDLQYLNGWSLWRDIAITCATVRVVCHERAF
ncbi:sugar transferase [Croceicoccus sp. F390]|uniref:Sugar transferase n=1 Tax=Croceicoccus esteveae TaxID=3075597 RepID=A0ABU2ZGM4_9SPHN|nr:sugar transferase [Croceicoccus sp. F390]MDT0575738.1 sugar transferase [Croceicoccus sp. F390]